MKDKKYLLRKVSGSKAKYKNSFDYDRNEDKNLDDEMIPNKRSMCSKNINRIDSSLVPRWLNTQIGLHFDDVYSEFLERIQPKYRDEYRKVLYNYVEKPEDTTIEDGKIFVRDSYHQIYKELEEGFYFCPETKLLCYLSVKKRTMTHKEGKKKYVEFVKESKKIQKQIKNAEKKKEEEAINILKTKKNENNS